MKTIKNKFMSKSQLQNKANGQGVFKLIAFVEVECQEFDHAYLELTEIEVKRCDVTVAKIIKDFKKEAFLKMKDVINECISEGWNSKDDCFEIGFKLSGEESSFDIAKFNVEI